MVTKSYTFQESVDYLLSLGNEVSAMKLGLDNIRKLLIALGGPARSILKVQVAGTNGKGSVCAFLNSICLEAGIKTGLYTSPHLISITERIKIDGSDISKDEFARIAGLVRKTAETLVEKGELETAPTFFEQVTAIALVAFAEHEVELIILETGLGGRLDATTAANAEIAAITRIDYDHQQYLGETIEEIAAEKAAIIHADCEAVLGPQRPEVLSVLRKRCNSLEVRFIDGSDDEYDWRVRPNEGGAVAVETTKHIFKSISLGLKGRHQAENAQTALWIVQLLRYGIGIDINDEHVIDGLTNATNPGRLEFIGNILLDGAHNPGGAKALREFLDEFIKQPIVMIFGSMADKNVAGIAGMLFPKAQTLILTQAANSRALPPNDLLKFVPAEFDPGRAILADDVQTALTEAQKIACDEKLILVTGSLYLVGEAKAIGEGRTK